MDSREIPRKFGKRRAMLMSINISTFARLVAPISAVVNSLHTTKTPNTSTWYSNRAYAHFATKFGTGANGVNG